MKLIIISASQRHHSQSAKVASYLAMSAEQFEQTTHIELCKYNLPFWDGEEDSKLDEKSSWPFISQQIKNADALVLITPEWGGMATPILKNFLLMCSADEVAHKPALLVSVVNGISGAYPIADLRGNALKNNKLVALPDHLIIRNVDHVLNVPLASVSKQPVLTLRESRLRERISYSLHMAYQYAQALKSIRFNHENSPYPNQQEYIYGM